MVNFIQFFEVSKDLADKWRASCQFSNDVTGELFNIPFKFDSFPSPEQVNAEVEKYLVIANTVVEEPIPEAEVV